MGTQIELTASDGHRARRLPRRAPGQADRGDRRDPGDFRRQPPHPLGLRPVCRARLCRGRAGAVRSPPARLPVGLLARRGAARPRLSRRGRLGCDDARRRGGGRTACARSGRWPWWASAWAARSPSWRLRGWTASPPRSATMAARSQPMPTRCRAVRPSCISAPRTRASRLPTSTRSRPSGPTARSTSTRAPATASTATSGAATIPRPRARPGGAAPTGSAGTWARCVNARDRAQERAMRVLFWVQQLLGSGHLKRAATLARAMADEGLEVTLAAGGMPMRVCCCRPGSRWSSCRPIRTSDPSFAQLVDAEGRPVDDALWQERQARLQRLLAAAPAAGVDHGDVPVRSARLPARAAAAARGRRGDAAAALAAVLGARHPGAKARARRATPGCAIWRSPTTTASWCTPIRS